MAAGDVVFGLGCCGCFGSEPPNCASIHVAAQVAWGQYLAYEMCSLGTHVYTGPGTGDYFSTLMFGMPGAFIGDPRNQTRYNSADIYAETTEAFNGAAIFFDGRQLTRKYDPQSGALKYWYQKWVHSDDGTTFTTQEWSWTLHTDGTTTETGTYFGLDVYPGWDPKSAVDGAVAAGGSGTFTSVVTVASLDMTQSWTDGGHYSGTYTGYVHLSDARTLATVLAEAQAMTGDLPLSDLTTVRSWLDTSTSPLMWGMGVFVRWQWAVGLPRAKTYDDGGAIYGVDAQQLVDFGGADYEAAPGWVTVQKFRYRDAMTVGDRDCVQSDEHYDPSSCTGGSCPNCGVIPVADNGVDNSATGSTHCVYKAGDWEWLSGDSVFTWYTAVVWAKLCNGEGGGCCTYP